MVLSHVRPASRGGIAAATDARVTRALILAIGLADEVPTMGQGKARATSAETPRADAALASGMARASSAADLSSASVRRAMWSSSSTSSPVRGSLSGLMASERRVRYAAW